MVKSMTQKQQHESDINNSSSCKFKGVRKRKWGKYVSEIRLPNSRERIWLGSYDSAEKAARAFDAALFCLRGRTANFNFPDSPPDIVDGRSLTPAEIQVAAAKFAKDTTRMRNSDPYNSSYSLSDSHVDSPSISISDGAVSLDGKMSEIPLDFAFLDIISTMESRSNNFADNGIFPGFDDFSCDVYVPSLPSVDYGDENCNYFSSEGSFLWNF